MYSVFSEFYDLFTKDVAYNEKAKFIDDMVSNYTAEKGILLDLGCGTGSLSIEMALLGYDVIGVDSSYDMLAVAREKAALQELSSEISFIAQKMERLDLYGTVDVAVCLLDSLNHIVDEKLFIKAIERVSLFLHPNGVFIFDLNTVFKHQHILANNCYIYEEDGVYCGWQNHTKDALTEITLDFFIKEGEDYYRQTEQFSERGYEREFVEEVIDKAGLKIEAVYDDYTKNPPADNTQRLVYVLTKKEKI